MRRQTRNGPRAGRRALVLFLLVSCLARAEERYTAREAMIPMRDGVRLYTQIFEPVAPATPCPILLTRTPYGIGDLPARLDPSTLGPSPRFARAGYVFVSQDVRGQFRSEGTWRVLMPPRSGDDGVDESTDTHDTIEWLLANVEEHNGRVGMWGISYDAWQTVMAMAEAHPALVAVSPQASPADLFVGDDLHHHGAFRLSYTFAWMAVMAARGGRGDPELLGPTLREDGYRFFLHAGSPHELGERYFPDMSDWWDVLEHPDRDEYWQRRDALSLLGDVRPAVLNVAGWFDAEDFRGPIDIYQEVEKNDERDHNFLVVGPWRHGGWNVRTGDTGASLGDLDFEEGTSEWFAEAVELPFFEHHLRDDADPLLAEALVFETGRNEWRELEEWPPSSAEPRPLYLHAQGRASFEAPAADESSTDFVSDPATPVPYTAQGPVFPEPGYMVEDQRYLDGRPDVLTFVTEPLEEDLVIAGRVEVELHFATTGSDADWIVKLIDVFPADTDAVSPATGESLADARMLLTGEIFRARYRDSFEHPSALTPDEVTGLSFPLPDRLHRFRAGHRLMVQVHSTWFPLYDRNPQRFIDVYSCPEDEREVATHRVFHEPGHASRLLLPVWPD